MPRLDQPIDVERADLLVTARGTDVDARLLCVHAVSRSDRPAMRVLVLAEKPPQAKFGDTYRLVGFMRPLVHKHEFHLLHFARAGQQLDPTVERLFSQVRALPLDESRQRGRIALAAHALSLKRFKPSSPQMIEEVRRAGRSGAYDVVYDLSGVMLLNIPEEGLPIPVVADSIDEPLLRDARAFREAGWPERLRLARYMWMYWRFNRKVLPRASVNIYASELDAQVFRKFGAPMDVRVIPNGVDTDYFRPASEPADPGLVTFEGNMMFGPNIDTAVRLCGDILPRVRAHRPDVRIALVGRDPAEQVRNLASSSVTVTGTVPDVRPYLWRAAVFACPMRLGAGIKNKILQAWAMGLPVVATPEALGGLEAVDGENALIREDPADFSNALIDVLESTELRRRLAAGGRATALDRYSWARQAGLLEQAFHDVVDLHNQRSRVAPHEAARVATLD